MIQTVESNTEIGPIQFEAIICDECETRSTILAAPGWMVVGIVRVDDDAVPAHFCCLTCGVKYFQKIIDAQPVPVPEKKTRRKGVKASGD